LFNQQQPGYDFNSQFQQRQNYPNQPPFGGLPQTTPYFGGSGMQVFTFFEHF
jgi:hypothetical protein